MTIATDITTTRPLNVIAREIRQDLARHGPQWRDRYYAAMPYLRAMTELTSVRECYGFDSGDSVVRYFLANAGTWRGETARRVKAELKAML